MLRAWSDGDEGAHERLLPLVEAELRRLARGYMARERRDHTLQPTALVKEAFLRLTDAVVMSSEPAVDLVALDRALDGLAVVDPRQAKVSELRAVAAARARRSTR